MKFKKFKNKANVIGKNIKKYRELRGYSQRALSDKLALLALCAVFSIFSFCCFVGFGKGKLL